MSELAILRQRPAESEKERGASTDVPELRHQAEKRLGAKQMETDEPRTEAMERLRHELQVQQIELEMQNEELRTAQARLKDSIRKYSDLYNFAPVGYLCLDEHGVIREANLTATRQLGVDRSSLTNTPFPVYVATSDRDQFRLHLKKVFQNKEQRSFEVRLLPRSGGDLWALLESIFVQGTDGKELCRTSVIDITERKQAEATLLESEQRVRRLNEHILNMVMVLSHDIRGPLVAIASILKLMLRGVYGKLDQSPANTVQELLSRCSRMFEYKLTKGTSRY